MSLSSGRQDRYVPVANEGLAEQCCEAPFVVSRASQGLEARRML